MLGLREVVRLWRISAVPVLAVTLLQGCGTGPPAAPAVRLATPQPTQSPARVRLTGTPERLTIAYVTSAAGPTDDGPNSLAIAELRQLSRDDGLPPARIIGTAAPSEYAGALEAASASSRVIGLGAGMAEAMNAAAKAHPETSFTLLDAPDGSRPEPNVHWIRFDMAQGAALAGLLAAGLSRSGTIGFVGGKESAAQQRLADAYALGARRWAKTSVIARYAGDDADQVTAKRVAQQLMSQNADVLFAGTFVDSLGAIAGASQARQLAIGIDRDEFTVAPNSVVSSVEKRTDVALGVVLNNYSAGWPGPVVTLGLGQEAVDLAPFHAFQERVSPALSEQLETLRRSLASGEVRVD